MKIYAITFKSDINNQKTNKYCYQTKLPPTNTSFKGKNLYNVTQRLFEKAILVLGEKDKIATRNSLLSFEKGNNSTLKLKIFGTENNVNVEYSYIYNPNQGRQDLTVIRESNGHGVVLLSPDDNTSPELIKSYNYTAQAKLLAIIDGGE